MVFGNSVIPSFLMGPMLRTWKKIITNINYLSEFMENAKQNGNFQNTKFEDSILTIQKPLLKKGNNEALI